MFLVLCGWGTALTRNSSSTSILSMYVRILTGFVSGRSRIKCLLQGQRISMNLQVRRRGFQGGLPELKNVLGIYLLAVEYMIL
jgi:hypothetical protein